MHVRSKMVFQHSLIAHFLPPRVNYSSPDPTFVRFLPRKQSSLFAREERKTLHEIRSVFLNNPRGGMQFERQARLVSENVGNRRCPKRGSGVVVHVASEKWNQLHVWVFEASEAIVELREKEENLYLIGR